MIDTCTFIKVFSLSEIALARISSGYRNRKVCHNQSSHQSCSFFPDFLWRQNPRRVESRKIWILERPCPSFLAVNLHYVNNCSIFSAFLTWSSTTCKLTAVFFMALKKRLVEKSLFHSSPGIYPAFALFATMLACFVTAFLYWTLYICTVFALGRT